MHPAGQQNSLPVQVQIAKIRYLTRKSALVGSGCNGCGKGPTDLYCNYRSALVDLPGRSFLDDSRDVILYYAQMGSSEVNES